MTIIIIRSIHLKEVQGFTHIQGKDPVKNIIVLRDLFTRQAKKVIHLKSLRTTDVIHIQKTITEVGIPPVKMKTVIIGLHQGLLTGMKQVDGMTLIITGHHTDRLASVYQEKVI